MKRSVLIGFAAVAVLGAGAAIEIHSQSASPGDSSVALASAPRVARSMISHPVKPARAQAQAAQAAVAPGLPPAYQTLLRRTIFAPASTPAARGKTRAIDSTLALRGIMQHGLGFIAFVENTSSHTALPVRVGDTVGHGKVVDIDLHAVKFTADGKAMRVEVGQTFDGGSSTAGTIPAVAAVRTAPE